MGIEGEMTGAFSKKWVLPSKYLRSWFRAHQCDLQHQSRTVEWLRKQINQSLFEFEATSKLNKGDGTTNALDVVCT